MVDRRDVVAVEEHSSDERELARRGACARAIAAKASAAAARRSRGAEPHFDTSFRPLPSSMSQPPVAAAG